MYTNIYEINVITLDVINFFLSNPEIAKEQYYCLVNNAKSRGLDKKVVPFYTEKNIIFALDVWKVLMKGVT